MGSLQPWQIYEQIAQNKQERGNQCHICGLWAVGFSTHLDAHVKTHTGLPTAILMECQLGKTRRQTASNVDVVVDTRPLTSTALQMYLSTPASVRHYGGCFHKGSLANSKLRREGMPRVFLKEGRLREKYRWIYEGQGPHPNHFHINKVQASQTRNPRRANVALPPPFRNRQRSPGAPTGFIEIETNLWTPGKFPNWPKPGGWQVDWPTDPTFIAQTQIQCEFCEDKACQCILTKVSRTRPKIVEAGEMGEGVQATQRYEVGEYIGELLGELVPLNSVNNGWSAYLCRDDISWDQRVWNVCQVDCKFTSKPVSGRWRILFQVVQAIEAGDAITVNYGAEYWESEGGPSCLCGAPACISKSMMPHRKRSHAC